MTLSKEEITQFKCAHIFITLEQNTYSVVNYFNLFSNKMKCSGHDNPLNMTFRRLVAQGRKYIGYYKYMLQKGP